MIRMRSATDGAAAFYTEGIMKDEQAKQLPSAAVEHVRDLCIRAAIEAYDDAKLRGLCHEGAWELAIQAMREVKLETDTDNPQPPRNNDKR